MTSDSDSFQTKGEKAVHRENAANLNLVFFPMKLCDFFSFKGQSSDFLHLSKSTHYCVRGRGISIACKLQIRHEYAPFWFCFFSGILCLVLVVCLGFVFFSFCTVTQKIYIKLFNKNSPQLCRVDILTKLYLCVQPYAGKISVVPEWCWLTQ